MAGDQVRLIVADDGVGLPEHVDTESGGSFGLRLVRVLTRQLGGTLAIRSAGGTEFQITFPLAKRAKGTPDAGEPPGSPDVP